MWEESAELGRSAGQMVALMARSRTGGSNRIGDAIFRALARADIGPAHGPTVRPDGAIRRFATSAYGDNSAARRVQATDATPKTAKPKPP